MFENREKNVDHRLPKYKRICANVVFWLNTKGRKFAFMKDSKNLRIIIVEKQKSEDLHNLKLKQLLEMMNGFCT